MKGRIFTTLLLALSLFSFSGVAFAGVITCYWDPVIYVNGVQINLLAEAKNLDNVVRLKVYTPPGATVVVDQTSLNVDSDPENEFELVLVEGNAGEIRVTNNGNAGYMAIDLFGDGTFEAEGYGNIELAITF
ncbi:MAG: hypothetical protein HYX86_06675 [Chloroflexi bacterium]|nr:hypothetical protein [Chloroflexota bacterium]